MKDRWKKWIQVIANNLTSVVIALLIMMSLQFINNARLTALITQVADTNSQVIDDVGLTLELMSEYGQDLNEVRELLYLPTKTYTATSLSGEAGGDTTTDVQDEDTVVQLFDLIETLGESEETATQRTQHQTDLEAYMNAQESLRFFASHGLHLRDGVTYHLAGDDGTLFFDMSVNKAGEIELGNLLKEVETFTDMEAFKAELTEQIESKLSEMKTTVAAVRQAQAAFYQLLTTDESVLAKLAENQISLSDPRTTETHYEYDLLSADNVPLATATVAQLEPIITLDTTEMSYESEGDQAELKTALLEWITPLDGRSSLEKAIDQQRADIDSLREDPGFQSLLNKYGYQFNFDAIETETTIDYEIKNEDGTVIKILYINTTTGELMLREPDSNTGSLLSTVLAPEALVPIDLPSVLNVDDDVVDLDSEVNILVAGKHGSNVDTMILANVDVLHQKVTLISIPRDLTYQSRKINSVYADYGMSELTRQLSDITGQKIDQYILVDMYVFIDLVDLVGGVDVALEEDLVDPTYKTYDNGMAGTLFYPAGTHHLTGVEALRVARSRYTTSDYSRAARQQIILSGLQDKAQDLGFGDAMTVVDIIETVLDKTESNLKLDEAAKYYFQYKDFELNSGYVLSSGNVLQSVKQPVNYVTSLRIDQCSQAAIEAKECDIQYAIYTLAPREENWDYIRWYVREALAD